MKLRVSSSIDLCARLRSARRSFLPSSTVGARTLLVMKDANVSISGQAWLATNRIRAVREWTIFISGGSRAGELSVLLKRSSVPGVFGFSFEGPSAVVSVSTPGTELLFRSTESSPALDPPLIKIVHSLTARILFVANQACPDMLTFASFMTNRVLAPTVEDGRKLLRALRVLAHTSKIQTTTATRNQS